MIYRLDRGFAAGHYAGGLELLQFLFRKLLLSSPVFRPLFHNHRPDRDEYEIEDE